MSSSRSASSDNGGGSYWGVGKLSLGGIGKVLATAVENQIAATVSPTAVSLPHHGNGSTGNIDQRPPPAKRSPHAQSKLNPLVSPTGRGQVDNNHAPGNSPGIAGNLVKMVTGYAAGPTAPPARREDCAVQLESMILQAPPNHSGIAVAVDSSSLAPVASHDFEYTWYRQFKQGTRAYRIDDTDPSCSWYPPSADDIGMNLCLKCTDIHNFGLQKVIAAKVEHADPKLVDVVEDAIEMNRLFVKKSVVAVSIHHGRQRDLAADSTSASSMDEEDEADNLNVPASVEATLDGVLISEKGGSSDSGLLITPSKRIRVTCVHPNSLQITVPLLIGSHSETTDKYAADIAPPLQTQPSMRWLGTEQGKLFEHLGTTIQDHHIMFESYLRRKRKEQERIVAADASAKQEGGFSVGPSGVTKLSHSNKDSAVVTPAANENLFEDEGMIVIDEDDHMLGSSDVNSSHRFDNTSFVNITDSEPAMTSQLSEESLNTLRRAEMEKLLYKEVSLSLSSHGGNSSHGGSMSGDEDSGMLSNQRLPKQMSIRILCQDRLTRDALVLSIRSLVSETPSLPTPVLMPSSSPTVLLSEEQRKAFLPWRQMEEMKMDIQGLSQNNDSIVRLPIISGAISPSAIPGLDAFTGEFTLGGEAEMTQVIISLEERALDLKTKRQNLFGVPIEKQVENSIEVQQLTRLCDDQKSKIEALCSKLDFSESALHQKVEQLLALNETLALENAQFAEELAAITSKYTSLEESSQQKESQMTKYADLQITELRTQVRLLEEQSSCASNDTYIDVLTKELDELKAQLVSRDEAIVELQVSASDMTSTHINSIASLTKALEDAHLEAESLKAQLADRDQSTADVVSAHSEAIASLTNSLKVTKTEAKSLKDQLAARDEELTQLHASIVVASVEEAHIESIASLTNSLDEANVEVDSLNAELTAGDRPIAQQDVSTSDEESTPVGAISTKASEEAEADAESLKSQRVVQVEKHTDETFVESASAHNAAISALMKSLDEAKVEAKSLKAQLNAEVEKRQALIDAEQSLHAGAIFSLTKSLNEVKAEAESYKVQIAILNDQIVQHQKTAATVELSVNEANDESIASLSNSLHEAKAEAKALKAQLAAQLEEHMQHKVSMVAEASLRTETIASLSKSLDEAHAKAESLTAQLADRDEQQASTCDAMSAHREAIASLTNSLKVTKTEAESLKDQLAARDEELAQLHASIVVASVEEAHIESIASLTNSLGEANAEVDSSNAQAVILQHVPVGAGVLHDSENEKVVLASFMHSKEGIVVAMPHGKSKIMSKLEADILQVLLSRREKQLKNQVEANDSAHSSAESDASVGKDIFRLLSEYKINSFIFPKAEPRAPVPDIAGMLDSIIFSRDETKDRQPSFDAEHISDVMPVNSNTLLTSASASPMLIGIDSLGGFRTVSKASSQPQSRDRSYSGDGVLLGSSSNHGFGDSPHCRSAAPEENILLEMSCALNDMLPPSEDTIASSSANSKGQIANSHSSGVLRSGSRETSLPRSQRIDASFNSSPHSSIGSAECKKYHSPEQRFSNGPPPVAFISATISGLDNPKNLFPVTGIEASKVSNEDWEELMELRMRVADLEDSLTHSEQGRKAAADKWPQLVRTFEEMKCSRNSSTRNVQKATRRIEALTAENDSLVGELSNLRKELQQTSETLQAKSLALKDVEKVHSEEILKLCKENQELSVQYHTLVREHGDMKNASIEKIRMLNESLVEAEAALIDYKSEYSTDANRLVDAYRDIESLQIEITSHQESATVAATRIKTLEADLTRAQKEGSGLTRECTRLKETIAAVQRNSEPLVKLKQDVASLQARLNQAEERNDILSSSLRDTTENCGKENKELQLQLGAALERANENELRIVELENELLLFSDNRQALSKQNNAGEEMKDQIKKLRQRLLETDQEVHAMQELLSAKQDENNELAHGKEVLEQEVETLRNTLEKRKSRIEKLKIEAADCKKLNEQSQLFEEERNRLKGIIDSLDKDRSELYTIRPQMAKLEAANADIKYQRDLLNNQTKRQTDELSANAIAFRNLENHIHVNETLHHTLKRELETMSMCAEDLRTIAFTLGEKYGSQQTVNDKLKEDLMLAYTADPIRVKTLNFMLAKLQGDKNHWENKAKSLSRDLHRKLLAGTPLQRELGRVSARLEEVEHERNAYKDAMVLACDSFTPQPQTSWLDYISS